MFIELGSHNDTRPARPWKRKITAFASHAERGAKGGQAGKGSTAKRASAIKAAQARWAGHAKQEVRGRDF